MRALGKLVASNGHYGHVGSGRYPPSTKITNVRLVCATHCIKVCKGGGSRSHFMKTKRIIS